MKHKSKYNGLSTSRIYKIYRAMLNRTRNKKTSTYKYYGGRGIKVCEEWQNNFLNFYNWSINNGYNENMTIDRIDVNGNYEPSNCRWVTLQEQANNKRNNHLITYQGKTKTISEWCKYLNINRSIISSRLEYGFPLDVVFSKRRASKKLIEYKGEFYTLSELAKLKNMSRQALYNRIYNLKWPLEKSLETPLEIHRSSKIK